MPLVQWSDSVVIAHLASEPQFRDDMDAVEEVVARQKQVSVVLDFSGVGYLNSSNISHLLRLRKSMIASDGRLVLCSIDTRVWSTFLITGLDKVFEYADDVTTGLAMVQLT